MDIRPVKPTLLQRALRFLAYFVVSCAILAGGLVIYWLVEPSDVLIAKNTPFPVHPDNLAPEDVIFITVNYCKIKRVDGTVIARLVGDKSITRLPWPNENSSPGCVNTDVKVTIPSFAKDDHYHFEFEIDYEINPLKHEVETLKSAPFTIVTKLLDNVKE